jgi:hypothetical protein
MATTRQSGATAMLAASPPDRRPVVGPDAAAPSAAMAEPRAADHLIDGRWSGLIRAGGVAAMLIAIVLIAEIAVYAALPRSETTIEHLRLLSDDWLGGLLTLDLLGMFAYLLLVPTILALYVALHRGSEGLMLVAAVLSFVGIADFLATNTALPALALAHDFAAAASESERTAILGAGHAMFALFNENAFLSSYVIVSVAWSLIGLAMLRTSLFGRRAAVIGILTGAAGVVAVILEHVSEALVDVAIPVYFVAIGLLLAWMVFVARRLWTLGYPRPIRAPRR